MILRISYITCIVYLLAALIIARRFPQLIKEEELSELNDETLSYDANRCILPITTDVEAYWKEVGDIKDCDGAVRFVRITQLARGLLCLPHGNADVERLFSHVSLIKTNKRNLLLDSTLCSLLHAKFNEKECFEFEPSLLDVISVSKATGKHLKRQAQKVTREVDSDIEEVIQEGEAGPSKSQEQPEKCCAEKKQHTLPALFKRQRVQKKNDDFYTGDYVVSDSD